MAEKNATKKTIIDISHPGDSTPTNTSKPVLVSNRPLLKDPMMVSADDLTQGPQAAPELDASEEIKTETNEVEPIVSEENASQAKTKIQPFSKIEKKEDVPFGGITPGSEAETAVIKKPFKDDSPDEIKDFDQEPEDLALADKRAEELQKLIDSKQYSLPINAVEKRRTHRTVVVGIILSVFLAALWLNIALDAGLITIPGLKAVTHFF